jgi:hypothetical protein
MSDKMQRRSFVCALRAFFQHFLYTVFANGIYAFGNSLPDIRSRLRLSNRNKLNIPRNPTGSHCRLTNSIPHQTNIPRNV